MEKSDGDPGESSRRAFLLSGGGMLTSLWVAAQWPSIAAAAHHAEQVATDTAPPRFDFLNSSDAADVEAICAQIVPSGATPGAREAHAVYFLSLIHI